MQSSHSTPNRCQSLMVVKADLDKVNVENPELAALLIHQLQEIAARGMKTNQLGSSVAALRELARQALMRAEEDLEWEGN